MYKRADKWNKKRHTRETNKTADYIKKVSWLLPLDTEKKIKEKCTAGI